MAVTLTARLWPGVGGGAVLNRFWLGCPRAIRQGTNKHFIIHLNTFLPYSLTTAR